MLSPTASALSSIQANKSSLSDPSYIYYRSEAKLYGVKMVGVSLYSKKRIRLENKSSKDWKARKNFDILKTMSGPSVMKNFRKRLTKIQGLSSSTRPTTQLVVFTNADLDFIGSLLKKYPKVVVF